MKTNRMAVLAAIALAGLVTFSVQAQDKPKGEGKAHPSVQQRGAKMAEQLGLTPEQQAQWKTVLKDQAEKGKAIRDDASLSQEQRREKNRALREETTRKTKEILTPEQQTKLEKLRSEGRSERQAAKPDAKK